MKKVLITGKNSYIGTSVEKWLIKEPKKYQVVTIDLKDSFWKRIDFSQYDVVFHVAGIAHVSSDPKMKNKYYEVNRDLTVEVAKKAKMDGVKQFIFMSSIIVYGDRSSRVITKETIPSPRDFYGDSKLQAEEGLKKLADDNFKIVLVRPPMIYGEGSKGNYPKLSKLAKLTPLFPDFYNERSVLHIDNLCELIKIVIKKEQVGLILPQNKEYVSTADLVKLISKINNNKVFFTKLFNPIIKLMLNNIYISKVFGNLTYEKSMSKIDGEEYQIRNLTQSIILTEVEKKL